LDLAPSQVPVDLTLTVSESSPWVLAQGLFKGEKPAVRIEGDVQLAAEVNWLADHVRWDIEEDISRIVGDAPAHMLVQACRNMLSALKNFVMQKSPPTSPASPSESAA
jgi:ubiquinone biosynthesis protein UbiJ